MEINKELIDYLEALSCLWLSGQEKERLSGDLKEILSYMERLGGADTGNAPEQSHPFNNVNSFRADEVRPSLDRELVLKNAPHRNDEMFIAPRAVE